jgi:hypothetical protein
VEHNDASLHYSIMDLLPQLEALEGAGDDCASVILTLCADQPILTDHVRYWDRQHCALRKTILAPPELV